MAVWLGKVTAMLWASGAHCAPAGLLYSSVGRAESGEVSHGTTGSSSHLSPRVCLLLLGV